MLVDTSYIEVLEKEYAIELRSSLIQQAKALEQQRAAVLAQVALLEKKYHIRKENGNNPRLSSERPSGT